MILWLYDSLWLVLLPVVSTPCMTLCSPRLGPGTAVIVEGVSSKPEWNGQRGLVQSFDEQRGRYALLVKGRARPLGVPPGCCRLESVVEQERQLQEAARVAARRAEVQESVRAALAARGAEPEP